MMMMMRSFLDFFMYNKDTTRTNDRREFFIFEFFPPKVTKLLPAFSIFRSSYVVGSSIWIPSIFIVRMNLSFLNASSLIIFKIIILDETNRISIGEPLLPKRSVERSVLRQCRHLHRYGVFHKVSGGLSSLAADRKMPLRRAPRGCKYTVFSDLGFHLIPLMRL